MPPGENPTAVNKYYYYYYYYSTGHDFWANCTSAISGLYTYGDSEFYQAFTLIRSLFRRDNHFC